LLLINLQSFIEPLHESLHTQAILIESKQKQIFKPELESFLKISTAIHAQLKTAKEDPLKRFTAAFVENV